MTASFVQQASAAARLDSLEFRLIRKADPSPSACVDPSPDANVDKQLAPEMTCLDRSEGLGQIKLSEEQIILSEDSADRIEAPTDLGKI
jgi:hypothetical protein